MSDDLRDLDRRCAGAMGWEIREPEGGYLYVPHPGAQGEKNGEYDWIEMPFFSSRIADAWPLVEWMRERGWIWTLTIDEIGCYAHLRPGDGYTSDGWLAQRADTAPKAIVRAFLAANEVQGMKGRETVAVAGTTPDRSGDACQQTLYTFAELGVAS